MLYTEKAKIIDRGSICSAPESTGSKLQFEPYLFSVACSHTELSISRKIWEIKYRVIFRKGEIIDRGSQCNVLVITGCKLVPEPCLFSVECS